MELAKYFKEFEEANQAQDHYKMMVIMQKFFDSIHNAHESVVLSYYSPSILIRGKKQPLD